MVSTIISALLPIVVTLLLGMAGGFAVAFVIARYLFRRDLMVSALQALAIGGPAVPFVGFMRHDYENFAFDRADLILAVGYELQEFAPVRVNPKRSEANLPRASPLVRIRPAPDGEGATGSRARRCRGQGRKRRWPGLYVRTMPTSFRY